MFEIIGFFDRLDGKPWDPEVIHGVIFMDENNKLYWMGRFYEPTFGIYHCTTSCSGAPLPTNIEHIASALDAYAENITPPYRHAGSV